MSAAPNLGGRPQSYLGSLEDRVVEDQCIARDLIQLDVTEWANRLEIARLNTAIRDALLAGDVPEALRLAGQQHVAIQAGLKADITENKMHRVIARGAQA